MRNTTRRLPRAVPLLLAALATVACTTALRPAERAYADAFGQLASWGSVGTGAGQLWRPSELGVDASDNSVYVLDAAADGNSFRLQKFDRAGSPLASVSIPRDTATNRPGLMGIAVDPGLHRVYLLQFRNALDTNTGQMAAEQLIVFSTQEAGGTLQAPGDVPSGTLPVPSPTSGNALDRPRGLAVDRTTHDLLVLAYDPTGNVAIQRISSSGSALGRYVDRPGSAFASFGGYGSFGGIAVAPDGTVYVGQGAAATFMDVFRLPATLASVAPVVTTQAPGEAWAVSGMATPWDPTGSGLGRQLALSPDGGTLYWSESLNAEFGANPGSYTIRGFSPATGKTVVLYGGGPAAGGDPSACVLTHRGVELATASDGSVYALDPGNFNAGSPTYGATVTRYGPGGSGCPAPVSTFSVAGSSESAVRVQKGATVAFDASGSELHGASPSELDWDFDGSGAFATAIRGTPAPLTTTHKYLQVGTFTVGLKMVLTGSALGDPPTVVRTVTVVAGTPSAAFRASTTNPAAGATVTFDAGTSVDPTGSDTAGPTSRLRTYRWDFGDGSTQTTSTATVDHAFANAGSSDIRRTVKLTVTSFDGVSNPTPVSQTITVQGAPVVVGPPPSGPPVVTPPPLVPALGRASLAAIAVRGANAALTIACAAGAGPCNGTVALTAVLPAPRRHGRAGKARATAVGSAHFALAAGAKAAVTVKLSRAARTVLARAHRLKLTVTLQTRTSAGATATFTKPVTVLLPVRRKAPARGRR